MKILIDLSILRHPFCGLGQIALNYGRWYGMHAKGLSGKADITLLVPTSHVGAFGGGVNYLETKTIYRFLPQLLPSFDLWHSIHQFSPFRPPKGATRILTIHDLNFLYEKTGTKRQQYLNRLQTECNRSGSICFISQFARDSALRHLNLEGKQLQTIYNGVEDLTEGPMQKPKGIDMSKPFLLCIGVVKRKKNVHTLLPMMDLLPEYNLIVAGNDTDSYARDIHDLLPNHPNVQMTGVVTDEERRWLYAHCSALVMPSLNEGFGLPVIEAMQWGKPVFASQHTSLPEIGGKHAFYFTDFTPTDMVDTINHGLAAFTPINATAEIEYAQKFSYDTHMQQYWNLYIEMLEKAGKGWTVEG